MKPKIPKLFPRALGQTVIVLPIIEDVKTESGLFLTNSDNTIFKQGYVFAVGADCVRKVIDFNGEKRILAPGDKVSYNTYANDTWLFEGVTYLKMTELDIHMLMHDEKPIKGIETPIKKRKRGFDGHDGLKL